VPGKKGNHDASVPRPEAQEQGRPPCLSSRQRQPKHKGGIAASKTNHIQHFGRERCNAADAQRVKFSWQKKEGTSLCSMDLPLRFYGGARLIPTTTTSHAKDKGLSDELFVGLFLPAGPSDTSLLSSEVNESKTPNNPVELLRNVAIQGHINDWF